MGESMVIKIRKPTASGLYCYHCDKRQCIYPTCQDINKAKKDGATDEQIKEVISAWAKTGEPNE